jgi:hypothetical protein
VRTKSADNPGPNAFVTGARGRELLIRARQDTNRSNVCTTWRGKADARRDSIANDDSSAANEHEAYSKMTSVIANRWKQGRQRRAGLGQLHAG